MISPETDENTPAAEAPEKGLREDLFKMRRLATGLLMGMAVVFVVARTLEEGASGWSWIRAFAEAAMVGALADWFAVTALFRHPLGLPIPHTAIVKTEQARIGSAVARFVRGSFLSRAEVDRQWEEWQPLDQLLRHLSQPEQTRKMLRWIVQQGPKFFQGQRDQSLSELLSTTMRRGLSALPVTKLLQVATNGFLKSPSRRQIIAPMLKRVSVMLDQNRDWVSEEAVKSSTPQKNQFFDKLTKAATAVVSTKAVEVSTRAAAPAREVTRGVVARARAAGSMLVADQAVKGAFRRPQSHRQPAPQPGRQPDPQPGPQPDLQPGRQPGRQPGPQLGPLGHPHQLRLQVTAVQSGT